MPNCIINIVIEQDDVVLGDMQSVCLDDDKMTGYCIKVRMPEEYFAYLSDNGHGSYNIVSKEVCIRGVHFTFDNPWYCMNNGNLIIIDRMDFGYEDFLDKSAWCKKTIPDDAGDGE